MQFTLCAGTIELGEYLELMFSFSLSPSLSVGEAEHLSRDFRRICDNYFPHQELAQIIGRQHVGTPQAQERISMVKATQ